MSQADKPFGFRIRPLPPKPQPAEPAQPSSEPPTPAATKPAPKPKPALAHTGALFNSAQAALAFLGAVAGAGLASEARARSGPDKRCWIEVPISWQQAAILAINAGGRAFAGGDRLWVEIPADGSEPAKSSANPGQDLLLQSPHGDLTLSFADWPELGLAQLLIATQLRRAKPRLQHQVVVLAPAVLARTILQRAIQLGLQVQLSAAQSQPLLGGQTNAISWLRIRWTQANAPENFLLSLTRYPFVAVARPLELEFRDNPANASLLVDIRYAAPLACSLVAPLVPEGEHWFFGGPDLGHWRVLNRAQPLDAAQLIALPDTADAAYATPELPSAAHPRPIPLRLIPRPPLPGLPDAVLLDDAELAWLSSYLIGKPAAETAYLLLGPGHHLLVAPGGLLSSLPFGLGLRRIGPGGIHLQEGFALYPPLPESARAQAFPCAQGEILTLSASSSPDGLACFRFRLDQLLPVWSLWLPEPIPVAEGVSGDLAKRVKELAESLKPKQPSKLRQLVGQLIPALGPKPAIDRDQLLREALRLQQQGRLVEAAQQLELAGELAQAGRLYERAAQQGG